MAQEIPERVFEKYHSPVKQGAARVLADVGALNWGLLMQSNWFQHYLTFEAIPIKGRAYEVHKQYKHEVQDLNYMGIYLESRTDYDLGKTPLPSMRTPEVWNLWEQLVDEGNVG